MYEDSNKCQRTVPKNKYEKNSEKMYEWWMQMFDLLESDFNIKDDTRYSTLKEILPIDLFVRLLRTVSVQQEKFQIDDDQPPDDSTKLTQLKALASTVVSLIDSEEGKKSATISEFRKNIGIKLEKKNPYIEFFKRKPNRAAIWKELPPLTWEEMNLGQMAEAITEAIAIDFVEWLKKVGGDEETALNVQSIKEMFEIGSQTNAATTVFVELKELASVTQKTAEAVGVPAKSRLNFLQEQIQQDKAASKMKPRIVAFGTRLPTYMQLKPPPKDLYKKWLQSEYISPKLESMATVWQGITNLRSTRVYCEFLYKDRPNIKPPKYLLECGMMEPKNFGKQFAKEDVDSDSIDDESNDEVREKSAAKRRSDKKKSVDTRKSMDKKKSVDTRKSMENRKSTDGRKKMSVASRKSANERRVTET